MAKVNPTVAKSIGAWELGCQKIFSLSRSFPGNVDSETKIIVSKMSYNDSFLMTNNSYLTGFEVCGLVETSLFNCVLYNFVSQTLARSESHFYFFST